MTPITALGALPGLAADAATAATPDAGFGATLAQVAREATATLRTAEASAAAGLDGAAPVQKVVADMLAAERGLQTAVAVRDRVVSALQEISRMQI